jgi:hypothetical protein
LEEDEGRALVTTSMGVGGHTLGSRRRRWRGVRSGVVMDRRDLDAGGAEERAAPRRLGLVGALAEEVERGFRVLVDFAGSNIGWVDLAQDKGSRRDGAVVEDRVELGGGANHRTEER